MPESNGPGQSPRSDVTELLVEASHGNREAFDRLVPLVYDELRALAEGRLRAERVGHTLNATALVHEAYVRLAAQERIAWQGRAHFFALASQAMRRVLVNYAEARNAQKRGGKAVHVNLDAVAERLAEHQAHEIMALDHALDELEAFNHRGARVIEYRFFGGLTHDEIGEVMGLSEVTVRRAWRAARAWLRGALDPEVTLDWAQGASSSADSGAAKRDRTDRN